MKIMSIWVVLLTVGLTGYFTWKTSGNRENRGTLQQDSDSVLTRRSNDQQELEVARARETIRMLDDIYKGGIVTITDKFVTEDSEIPAGTAFKLIFEIAKEKGWHEARLLDVTGEPYNDENVANDDFEKRAVRKIASGNPFYEEIEEKDGERYLRVMTPIPVVFEKCTWCHSNYEDVADGQAIGAMGYRIRIPKPGEVPGKRLK